MAPLREFIGQERAARAVEFGLSIANHGYNIYVAGLTGTGKTSMVKTYIERLIKEKKAKGEMPTLDGGEAEGLLCRGKEGGKMTGERLTQKVTCQP